MKKLAIPCRRCHSNSAGPGQYPAQTDLGIPPAGDATRFDEAVHRRPVRVLDTEDLAARVRMRVEVDQAHRPAALCDRCDTRLRDRVVAPERDGQRACIDDLAHQRLDRRVRSRRVGGDHRRVAVVDDRERGERVDPRLEVRTGRARRGPDRTRCEPRAGTVRDEVVGRRHDRDVDAGEVLRLLREERAAEGEEAGVVGLVVEGDANAVAGRSCVQHLTARRGRTGRRWLGPPRRGPRPRGSLSHSGARDTRAVDWRVTPGGRGARP